MVEFKCNKQGQNKWSECKKYNENMNVRTKERIEIAQQKSTFIGLNSSRREYFTHNIDNCIIPPSAQTPKRGDYLLFQVERGHLWLVELKGNSLDDAYKQLAKTFEQISGQINEWQLNGKRHACVVLSSYKSATSMSHNLAERRSYLRKKGFELIDNYSLKTWGKMVVNLDVE